MIARRLAMRAGIACCFALVLASGALGAVRALHIPTPWSAQNEFAHIFPATDMSARSSTDDVIASNQQRLHAVPKDGLAYLHLGEAYLQKARDTGDPSYYTKADDVLKQANTYLPNDAEVFAAQGSLALERHQFREALALGTKAHTFDQFSAAALGIMGDAQVELGAYPDAIKTIQAMADVRPDLSSYARVSYIRELRGDYAGAESAMQQAAMFGAGAPENLAWTSWQLGTLYFDQGKLDAAQHEYERSLSIVPHYVHGEGGLATIAAARGDYDSAIAHYHTAINVMPYPEYVIKLGDVYAAAGRNEEAQREYGLVDAIERLYEANGVNTDMDLALFDADHLRNMQRARELAHKALTDRPSVMAADVLAWTLYQSGDCAGAATAEEQAMRLGTRLPLMLFHAGMIARCAGDNAAAQRYLTQVQDLNPHFTVLYEGVARDALRSLNASSPAASGS